MIRKVRNSDINRICEIYNYYINNTTITFEESEVEKNEMEKRISEAAKNFSWIIFEEKGETVGYAYAAKWKDRNAYRHCAESSVYLDKGFLGKGIGKKLLSRLIEEVKAKKIHSLIGGIALPNRESIGLYQKLGFKKVAHFKEVGFKFGRWIDVGYWEKII
ncbi:MAG: N-acetyltransferase family protein [Bacteroidota bacterium]|nr:N-acetyltransferase family protein [Bacteroidota bacterium]